MISVLNFKKFERGSLLGFFTLRYHGLSIQNCRLMAGKNGSGPWFSFPQIKVEKDGETEYHDLMYLTPPEREHVRALIMAELQAQGHVEAPKTKKQGNGKGQYRTPEKEDLAEYYPEPDDLPF